MNVPEVAIDFGLGSAQNDLPETFCAEDDPLTNAQKEADAIRDRKISRNISIAALIIPALVFGYTLYRDNKNAKSADHRFGNIETSLRILTASVAPQLYQSISDSLLSAAMTADEPHVVNSLKATDAAISQLELSKVPPDQTRIRENGVALVSVSFAHPDFPSVWNTASRLISYRSFDRNSGSSTLCVDTNHDGSKAFNTDKEKVSLYGAFYHDCTFVIDDYEGFRNSPVSARYEQSKVAYPLSTLAFGFDRVHIVYRGGKLIPAAKYQFTNCTFEFKPPSTVPSNPSKAVFRGLLTADLSQPIDISTTGL